MPARCTWAALEAAGAGAGRALRRLALARDRRADEPGLPAVQNAANPPRDEHNARISACQALMLPMRVERVGFGEFRTG